MSEDKPAQNPSVYVERTLALIKPNAIEHAEVIEDLILRSGFIITQKRMLQLSPEQCSDFYEEHYGTTHFPSLTAFMSSGPIMALGLARENAIAHWKAMMGPVNNAEAKEHHPDSLRAKYGTSDLRNAVHGSESRDAAEREIKFMFPNAVIDPLPTRQTTEEYLSKYVIPTLVLGLTELCKHKPLIPSVWLADWLLKNNPNKPQIYDGTIMEEPQPQQFKPDHYRSSAM